MSSEVSWPETLVARNTKIQLLEELIMEVTSGKVIKDRTNGTVYIASGTKLCVALKQIPRAHGPLESSEEFFLT